MFKCKVRNDDYAGKIYKWLNRLDDPDYCWRLRQKLTTPSKGLGKLTRLYPMYQYKKAQRRAGATIPLGTKFGGKPDFPHGFYGIFISYGAKLGKNCTIFQQVTIGSNTLAGTKNPGAPVIGDNVYIGAAPRSLAACILAAMCESAPIAWSPPIFPTTVLWFCLLPE